MVVRNGRCRVTSVLTAMETKLYVEEWQAHCGAPTQVDGDDLRGTGVRVESSDAFSIAPTETA